MIHVCTLLYILMVMVQNAHSSPPCCLSFDCTSPSAQPPKTPWVEVSRVGAKQPPPPLRRMMRAADGAAALRRHRGAEMKIAAPEAESWVTGHRCHHHQCPRHADLFSLCLPSQSS